MSLNKYEVQIIVYKPVFTIIINNRSYFATVACRQSIKNAW